MADLSEQNETEVRVEAAIGPPAGKIRGLAHSFAAYGIANIGIRGLNFLLILVYAHYLMPSDYGIIYLAEIIASFLSIFAGLSIDSALQRLYFQHHHDAEELRSYLGSATRFGLVWMALFLTLILALGRVMQFHRPAYTSVPFYPYIAIAVATATVLQGVQYRLAVYQASRRPWSYARL